MDMLSGFAPAQAGWVSGGHAIVPPFRLHRPRTVAEAARLLAGGARALAGGIDLIAGLRDGRAAAEVAWLGGVAELGAIEARPDALVIGAGVTHYRVETDPVIAECRPDIAAAWRTIGNVRVRMAGTVGGNLLAGNPQYDGPAILAAAGARLVFAGPVGHGADAETAIDLGRAPAVDPPARALLVRVEIPRGGGRAVLFDRALKPAVSVALGIVRAEDGTYAARVCVGCAHERPETVVLWDRGASPAGLSAAAEGVADALPPAIDDALASAGYRRRMAGVLARRLVARALAGEGAAA